MPIESLFLAEVNLALFMCRLGDFLVPISSEVISESLITLNNLFERIRI